MDMKKTFAFIALAALLVLIAAALPASAAAPDARVKGLWLKCPDFPKEAIATEFEYDKDTGFVSYSRALDDDTVYFIIRRRPIEDSELQEPDDVRDYVETLVRDSGGNEEHFDVDTDAEGLVDLFGYPSAMAIYQTGQDEYACMTAVVYIFTDEYVFEAEMSVGVPCFEDYEDRMSDWLAGLELVEK